MKLKFFATYRDITRRKEEFVPAPPDVWTLLLKLGEQYGSPFRAKMFTPDGAGISDETIILLNGRNICHLDGKDTLLTENDTVSIFPVVAGG